MKIVIKFELRRLVNYRNRILFIIFTIMLVFSAWSGVESWKDYLQKEKNFCQFEELKIKKYFTYEQYGAYGFRVMSRPSPLAMFFSQSILNKQMMSEINTKETVDVFQATRGKNLFNSGLDITEIFLFFGGIIMLYMGLTAIGSNDLCELLRKKSAILLLVFFRLVLLDIIFLVISFIPIIVPLIQKISFTGNEYLHYLIVILIFILVVNLMYVLGFLLMLIFRWKKNAYYVSLALFLFCVIIIPGVAKNLVRIKARGLPNIESINIQKISNSMKFEREALEVLRKMKEKGESGIQEKMGEMADRYIKKTKKRNDILEEKFVASLRGIVKYHRSYAGVFPWVFASKMATELSGTGYSSYLSYLDYVFEIRTKFHEYYIEKRFRRNEPVQALFQKTNEYIYRSKSKLSGLLIYGVTFCLFYFVISMSLIWRLINKLTGFDSKLGFLENESNGKEGYIFFLAISDKWKKQSSQIVWSTSIALLKKYRVKEILEEINIKTLFEFLSELRGVEFKTFTSNLERYFGASLREKDSELLDKAIGALVLSEEKRVYIIDDFAKGTSRELEKNLMEFLHTLAKEGKTIYYISQDFPSPKTQFDEAKRLDKKLLVDPRFVSVR